MQLIHYTSPQFLRDNYTISPHQAISLRGEFLSVIQVWFELIRQPRWPSFSHIQLLNKESCRVAVSSYSAVTGKACTCPLTKQHRLLKTDILAFHLVEVAETTHRHSHALFSVSIWSHRCMLTAGVPTSAVVQLLRVVCSSWVPTVWWVACDQWLEQIYVCTNTGGIFWFHTPVTTPHARFQDGSSQHWSKFAMHMQWAV